MSLSHPHLVRTGRKMQRGIPSGPRERTGRKELCAALQVQSGPEDAEGILPGPESVGGEWSPRSRVGGAWSVLFSIL